MKKWFLLLALLPACATAPEPEPAPVQEATCAILGYSSDGETQLMVFNFEDAPSPDSANCKNAGNSSSFICKLNTCVPLDYSAEPGLVACQRCK